MKEHSENSISNDTDPSTIQNQVSNDEEKNLSDPEKELCKLVTGLDYTENPEKVFREMIEDRKIVSEKYGVPLPEKYKDKKEYCDKLLEIARINNAEIAYKDSYSLSLEGLGGGLTKDNKIVVPKIDFNVSSVAEIYDWGLKLEHELLHFLQGKVSPQDSIERNEYEAYLISSLPNISYQTAKEFNQEGYIRSFMVVSNFFTEVKESCLGYYRRIGKKESEISWIK
jgi:hypothetical protein